MRRTSTVFFALVVLLGAWFVGGSSIAAQDQDHGSDLADHPLVGSWQLDVDTQDPTNPPSLGIFSSDGTYLETDFEGSAVGVWEATGDHSANMTFWFPADAEGGMAVVRASIDVADDGESFTAPYTLEFIAPDGTSSGQASPATAVGTRLHVEEMGTPVISLRDLFPATPAATPAS